MIAEQILFTGLGISLSLAAVCVLLGGILSKLERIAQALEDKEQ